MAWLAHVTERITPPPPPDARGCTSLGKERRTPSFLPGQDERRCFTNTDDWLDKAYRLKSHKCTIFKTEKQIPVMKEENRTMARKRNCMKIPFRPITPTIYTSIVGFSFKSTFIPFRHRGKHDYSVAQVYALIPGAKGTIRSCRQTMAPDSSTCLNGRQSAHQTRGSC